jgi:hypothetical protein
MSSELAGSGLMLILGRLIPLRTKHALDPSPIHLYDNRRRSDGTRYSLQDHASCSWIEVCEHPA